MLIGGLRYGFLSCYDETLFLRVEIESSTNDSTQKFPRLFYSNVINDTDGLDETANALKVPVRLALLYLFKLASEGSGWSFPRGSVNPLGYTAVTEFGRDLDSRGRHLSY